MILLAAILFCLLTHLWISYSNSSILRPLPRSKASITQAKRPLGSLLASSGSLGNLCNSGLFGKWLLEVVGWVKSVGKRVLHQKNPCPFIGCQRFHQSPVVCVNSNCQTTLKTIHQSVEEYTLFPSDQQLPGDH